MYIIIEDISQSIHGTKKKNLNSKNLYLDLDLTASRKFLDTWLSLFWNFNLLQQNIIAS